MSGLNEVLYEELYKGFKYSVDLTLTKALENMIASRFPESPAGAPFSAQVPWLDLAPSGCCLCRCFKIIRIKRRCKFADPCLKMLERWMCLHVFTMIQEEWNPESWFRAVLICLCYLYLFVLACLRRWSANSSTFSLVLLLMWKWALMNRPVLIWFEAFHLWTWPMPRWFRFTAR